MNLRIGYTASEDTFPLPAEIREFYGPFGFPPNPRADRPYVTSNFVMGLDGRVSFRELAGRAGGREVSRSAEDRWLMDFLRAHHDALLMGARTLREEPGKDGAGWDFGIGDDSLREYREKTLKLPRLKVMILSGSGNVDLNFRVFHSPRVEPWMITAPDGEKKLLEELASRGESGNVRIVTAGAGVQVDVVRAFQILRSEYGIRTLLCEGGPTLYSQLLERRLVDEEFRAIAMQVLGETTDPRVVRPTAYGHSSFVPETAPWFRLISLHYALPYHVFLRLRYEGPRTF